MNNQMITSDEKSVALEFVSKVRGYLSEAADSFFKIGYELHKAQEGQRFKALGYDSLEDLSEDAFGFSKTQTYDLIKVYNACRSPFIESKMLDTYTPYSFSQLAAMQTGSYAGVDVMFSRVKPTDSVRAIKKYVSFFNKYTGKHSVYPSVTLQEWLAQEEERQEEIETSEQLQLGELVEEEAPGETPGEIFRTSELQEVVEESEIEEQEEIEEEIPNEMSGPFGGQVLPKKKYITPLVVIKERNEQENVSRETETKTQRYTFGNRAQARAFMSDYKNWEFLGNCGMESSFFLMRYRYMAKNDDMFFALEVRTCKGIDEEGITLDNQVEYYLKPHCGYAAPFKVTKDQLEKYIAAHADNL